MWIGLKISNFSVRIYWNPVAKQRQRQPQQLPPYMNVDDDGDAAVDDGVKFPKKIY